MGGRWRTEVKRGGRGLSVQYNLPSSRGSLSSQQPTPLLLLPTPHGQPQLITALSPTFAKIYIALSKKTPFIHFFCSKSNLYTCTCTLPPLFISTGPGQNRDAKNDQKPFLCHLFASLLTFPFSCLLQRYSISSMLKLIMIYMLKFSHFE